MKKRQCAQKEPRRIVIEKIDPLIDNGKFPVKRSEGELINVSADIYADGHDTIKAAILYREKDQERYLSERMQHICNDRWEGCFEIKERSGYFYSIQAWVDHFATWRTDMIKKLKAGEEDQADKRLGADLINKAAKQANKSAGEALEMYAELLLKETEKTHLIDVLDSPRLLNLMD